MLLLKANRQQRVKQQYGKTNTPLQLLRFMYTITRGIKYIGGIK